MQIHSNYTVITLDYQLFPHKKGDKEATLLLSPKCSFCVFGDMGSIPHVTSHILRTKPLRFFRIIACGESSPSPRQLPRSTPPAQVPGAIPHSRRRTCPSPSCCSPPCCPPLSSPRSPDPYPPKASDNNVPRRCLSGSALLFPASARPSDW